MDYKTRYEAWLGDAAIDEATKAELRGIQDDDTEIKERFYKELEFGTGGLRGVLGAGSNRLNIYTIRKATQGLANYILQHAGADAAVAIAHDCRRMSPEFTREAALVLNANGIKTYVFDGLRPTPVLSFAVRRLRCAAGIVITASHNPPEYNGYKAYWSDGGQVPYPRDEAIITEVNKITAFSQIKTMTEADAKAQGLYRLAPAALDDDYTRAVTACCLHPEIIPESDLKIVYTPLHGTGNVPVRRALAETGFKHVYVVPRQEAPDGDFPTVSYPNPEDRKAFALALALAEEKDADIIIATDPDADRVGVAVKHGGEYVFLNGNMTGVLLTEYLLSQKTPPRNAAVVSTIVSTDMTKAIAAAYGAAYFDVLTGFKYIGEKIKEFEDSGDYAYVFGFEESYGCLPGTYTRDKDAVAAALLVCETAAFYRKQGLTLADALRQLYEKYGYYNESVESLAYAGIEGQKNIGRIMAALRDNPPKTFAGADVTEARDYLRETITYADGRVAPTGLPVSDVLYFTLADGSWACVRPSGTEPKIKIYFGVNIPGDVAAAQVKAQERLAALWAAMKRIVDEAVR